MRSLTLLSCSTYTVDGKRAEARCTSLAIRPEETPLTTGQSETLYLTAERQLPDGGVEIQILVGNCESSIPQQPIASFQAPPEPPFKLVNARHTVSFRYLAESNTLALVLAGGDIVVVNLEDELMPSQDRVEVVGSVEVGIKAAEWSPDEELLVLITGEDNLVEMTKTFDVLAETPLKTEDFGQDAPVNLGWGNQKTQFFGSVGKAGRDAAAGLPAATLQNPLAGPSNGETPGQSVYDDTATHISWRGDGAFFAVSTTFSITRTNESQRRIRFYSRTAVLQATSERTPGLEGTLAWQPSGSIIAAAASQASQIVFYERNGLRRYEFDLKEEKLEYGSVIRQLAWNVDSTVLAVWVERLNLTPETGRHAVQLWRRNNYHWYLKQSIRPMLAESDTLEQIAWSLEEPLGLHLVTSMGCDKRLYAWDTFASARPVPSDSGAVVVVDGDQLLFTAFRYQNIPPPMSSLTLRDSLGQTAVHATFSDNEDLLAALMPDGHVNVWTWSFGKGNKSSTRHIARLALPQTNPQTHIYQQVAVTGCSATKNLRIYALLWSTSARTTQLFSASLHVGDAAPWLDAEPLITLSSSVNRLIASSDGVRLQRSDGSLTDAKLGIVARLPERCPYVRTLNGAVHLGLSDSGRLYANDRQLASGVTSFAIGGDFLVYTTLQHDARFLLLRSILDGPAPDEEAEDVYTHPVKPQRAQDDGAEKKQDGDSYSRRVERGSRIVTVVPSSMTLVLQMPRGNLETVSPRPLVLQEVRRYLDDRQYREAFLVCRRHRIDLNFLCDHNPTAFQADLALFIDQIADNEHLGLFASGLKNEDVSQTMYRSLTVSPPRDNEEYTKSKVNTLCRSLRRCLEAKDLVVFANAILTTYVCQQPGDLESALQLITRIKPINAEAAEDAIKYIIFLADANKLFDVALGMYDFELVLAVAQNSQKDPREYIPFLRELRGHEKYFQRFKIDDHLKLYKKALFNLSLAGSDHFETTIAYMRQYELYDDAVAAYAKRPELHTILDIRGDWLMKDDRCHEAALSYSLAQQPRKAMVAHQRALTWVELFEIALKEELSAEEIGTLAQNTAEALKGKGRYAEAGRVLLEYGRDVKGAVAALSEGNDFAEAMRIASLYAAPTLIAESVVPAVIDASERLADEAEEMGEQVRKQSERLAELREKRVSDSATFYGRLLPSTGDDALDNVDVQTDAGASTVATTQFTRYTAAPASTRTGTVKSGYSRRTAQKQMRKAAAGAKGSIFEESYLLGSLTRLIQEGGKLPALVASTASLTRTMVRLSAMPSVAASLDSDVSLVHMAHELQTKVAGLVAIVTGKIDDIWTALGDAKLHDLETALLADADPEQPQAEVLKRPSKPKMAPLGHWQVGLLPLLAGGSS